MNLSFRLFKATLWQLLAGPKAAVMDPKIWEEAYKRGRGQHNMPGQGFVTPGEQFAKWAATQGSNMATAPLTPNSEPSLLWWFLTAIVGFIWTLICYSFYVVLVAGCLFGLWQVSPLFIKALKKIWRGFQWLWAQVVPQEGFWHTMRGVYFAVRFHPVWNEVGNSPLWRMLKRGFWTVLCLFLIWSWYSNMEEKSPKPKTVSLRGAAEHGFAVPMWAQLASEGQRSRTDDYYVPAIGSDPPVKKSWREYVGLAPEREVTLIVTKTKPAPEPITITKTSTVGSPESSNKDQAMPSVVTTTTTVTEFEKRPGEIVTTTVSQRDTITLTSKATLLQPTIIANVTPTTMISFSTVTAPERTITIYADEADVTTSTAGETMERRRRDVGSGELQWCEECRQKHL